MAPLDAVAGSGWRAWPHWPRSLPGAPLVLAKYLSGTSWYGHSDELERIASLAGARAPADGGTAGRDGESVDIGRFSGIIRARIALMRIPGPSAGRQADVQ